MLDDEYYTYGYKVFRDNNYMSSFIIIVFRQSIFIDIYNLTLR